MVEATMNDAATMRPGGGSALGRIDQYELVRELGGGGFGTVYLARDTVSGVEVAVKGLPPMMKNNREEMENIRVNFALVARLTHTNIAKALVLHPAKNVGYVSEDVREKLRVMPGDTLMVMEYAPGVTLSKWRKQFPGGKVPLDQALQIGLQIAQALDYAHGQHIIHRDIKPSNIMVETKPDGETVARLLDFGLAAEIRSSMGRVSREIHDTSGTRPYMAPEQWAGRKQGPATDQYALAVLLCELLTGDVPFASAFETGDPVMMMNIVRHEPFTPPPELPKPMCFAFVKALAKEPEERFASCGEFVAGLEGRIAHQGKGVRVVSVLAIFALLTGLVCGAWWLLWNTDDVCDTPPPASNVTTHQTREDHPAEPEKDSSIRSSSSPTGVQSESSPAAAVDGSVSEPERIAEFMRLKTLINVKTETAKRQMRYISEFYGDSKGLEGRIRSALSQWQTLSALAQPSNLEEARAAFDIAEKAEGQIASDLDWLRQNKAGRDETGAVSAEIVALLANAATVFNAEKNASTVYNEGCALYESGVAAFKKGDFVLSKRLMKEAKEKLVEAIRDAKAFCINNMLKSAREHLNAGQWHVCIKEAEKILELDATNEGARFLRKDAEFGIIGEALEAARKHLKAGEWDDCIEEAEKVLDLDTTNRTALSLREEALSHIVPSATFTAKIGQRKVQGAKVKIGDHEYNLPLTFKRLKGGSSIGPFKVRYLEGGKWYKSTVKAITVNWQGPKTLAFSLKEYVAPKHGDRKTLTLPGGAVMDMIYVAPGSFTMGSPKHEEGRDNDETQHRVTLTKGFWLGKYEVTQEQWTSVMEGNPSGFKGDRNPVENVSWDDCQQFIQKVNAQLVCGARLPTEAEWEYACRAGTTTAYSWGSSLNGDRANCDGTHPCGTTAKGPYKQTTMPVGSYAANAWGFCDMHGNVDEWCSDWFGSYGGNVTDPLGPASGVRRVLRGGSWNVIARLCRSSCRRWYATGALDRCSRYGFRLCCSEGPCE